MNNLRKIVLNLKSELDELSKVVTEKEKHLWDIIRASYDQKFTEIVCDGEVVGFFFVHEVQIGNIYGKIYWLGGSYICTACCGNIQDIVDEYIPITEENLIKKYTSTIEDLTAILTQLKDSNSSIY